VVDLNAFALTYDSAEREATLSYAVTISPEVPAVSTVPPYEIEFFVDDGTGDVLVDDDLESPPEQTARGSYTMRINLSDEAYYVPAGGWIRAVVDGQDVPGEVRESEEQSNNLTKQ
jgi:hypothetical protein